MSRIASSVPSLAWLWSVDMDEYSRAATLDDLKLLLLTKQTMRNKDASDRIIIERAIDAVKEISS